MPDRGVLTHVYRGELSRMLAYRARLDTTTNWAIGVSAAILTFTLGHPEIPHTAMLVAVLLDVQLLWLETRRYRAFDLSRRRLRLLEGGFVADELGGGHPWLDALRSSYREPTWQIGVLAAAGHRVRRNYLWLILSVQAAWLIKLRMHGLGTAREAARVGLVPGEAVFAIMGLLLLALVLLAVWAHREEPT